MTIVTDLIEDLKEELDALSKYSNLLEIDPKNIKPLWWTDKYDGKYLAGFCEYNNKVYRFQIIYSNYSEDINIYTLQTVNEEQISEEIRRIKDWESMVGFNRSFIGQNNNWNTKEISTNKVPGIDIFYSKYFDDKRVSFKNTLDYSNNESSYIFSLN